MDLWIRSQDRETLLKVTNFLCYAGFHEIRYPLLNDEYIVLGEYKTKERALEVLDEINDLLEQEELLHIRKSSLNNLDEMAEPKYILKPVGQPKVYKMPLE